MNETYHECEREFVPYPYSALRVCALNVCLLIYQKREREFDVKKVFPEAKIKSYILEFEELM